MTATQAQIRIGIVGYGNLGRGVELAIGKNPDMALTGIFTRREPAAIHSAGAAPVYALNAIDEHAAEPDVLVLCGGSRTDLAVQAPWLAQRFCIVDSFDTHARIPEHFAAVDAAARAGGTTALVSAGWDPGIFSLQRVFAQAVLPDGMSETFWGPGVSQGHSDALRRVPGVAAGVQHTIPRESAIEAVRRGERREFGAREERRRECRGLMRHARNCGGFSGTTGRSGRMARFLPEAAGASPDKTGQIRPRSRFASRGIRARQDGSGARGRAPWHVRRPD